MTEAGLELAARTPRGPRNELNLVSREAPAAWRANGPLAQAAMRLGDALGALEAGAEDGDATILLDGVLARARRVVQDTRGQRRPTWDVVLLNVGEVEASLRARLEGLASGYLDRLSARVRDEAWDMDSAPGGVSVDPDLSALRAEVLELCASAEAEEGERAPTTQAAEDPEAPEPRGQKPPRTEPRKTQKAGGGWRRRLIPEILVLVVLAGAGGAALFWPGPPSAPSGEAPRDGATPAPPSPSGAGGPNPLALAGKLRDDLAAAAVSSMGPRIDLICPDPQAVSVFPAPDPQAVSVFPAPEPRPEDQKAPDCGAETPELLARSLAGLPPGMLEALADPAQRRALSAGLFLPQAPEQARSLLGPARFSPKTACEHRRLASDALTILHRLASHAKTADPYSEAPDGGQPAGVVPIAVCRLTETLRNGEARDPGGICAPLGTAAGAVSGLAAPGLGETRFWLDGREWEDLAFALDLVVATNDVLIDRDPSAVPLLGDPRGQLEALAARSVPPALQMGGSRNRGARHVQQCFSLLRESLVELGRFAPR